MACRQESSNICWNFLFFTVIFSRISLFFTPPLFKTIFPFAQANQMASNPTSAVDVNRPLYLHPLDVQGVTLVPQVLTGSSDYVVWSRAMRLVLRGKNKLAFSDESYPREKETKFPELWDQCNTVVLSWLLNSVNGEIVNGIVFSEDAHQVWVDLGQRFHKMNGAKIFSLHRSISSLTQGTFSISAYFTQLKCLRDEYSQLVPPFLHVNAQPLLSMLNSGTTTISAILNETCWAYSNFLRTVATLLGISRMAEALALVALRVFAATQAKGEIWLDIEVVQ